MNGGFSATKSARAPANLRRGFFRLWLVLSLCWIAGASWFLRDQLYFGYTWEMPWRLIAPQFVDLPSHEFEKLSPEQREKYIAQKKQATARGLYCPTGASHNRPVDELTPDEVACELAEFTAKFWQGRLNAASIVFGPPLALFIFGCLVGWIIRGFAPYYRRKDLKLPDDR